jgi:hypothetical protein
VTTALPPDADAGIAVTATEAVVGAAEPAAGHTRTALDTVARLDSTARWAASRAAAAGCLLAGKK